MAILNKETVQKRCALVFISPSFRPFRDPPGPCMGRAVTRGENGRRMNAFCDWLFSEPVSRVIEWVKKWEKETTCQPS